MTLLQLMRRTGILAQVLNAVLKLLIVHKHKRLLILLNYPMLILSLHQI